MKEKRLQHELIMWFGQTYPELHGCLFEANNDTYNIQHAQTRRSMGMISGVSDLILIANGCMAGMEIKGLDSRHKTDHIKNQRQWGSKIIRNGGAYLMCSYLSVFQIFIDAFVAGNKEEYLFIQNKY